MTFTVKSPMRMVFGILECCKVPSKRSQIMRSSSTSLNYSRMKEYTNSLADLGFLEWIPNPEKDKRTPELLIITSRGKELLSDMKPVLKVIDKVHERWKKIKVEKGYD